MIVSLSGLFLLLIVIIVHMQLCISYIFSCFAFLPFLPAFVDLVHQSNGSMPRGRNDDGSKDYKQVKVLKKRERNVTVVPTHLTQTNVSGVKGETFIFTNMMFCIHYWSQTFALVKVDMRVIFP